MRFGGRSQDTLFRYNNIARISLSDLSDRVGCTVGSNELARPNSDPCGGSRHRCSFGGRFAGPALACTSPRLLDCACRIGSGTGRINRQHVNGRVVNGMAGEVEKLRFTCTGYAQRAVRVGCRIADGLHTPFGEHKWLAVVPGRDQDQDHDGQVDRYHPGRYRRHRPCGQTDEGC